MTMGLLDPAILTFVFGPALVGAALLMARWRRNVRQMPVELDAPAAMLTSVVRVMPQIREEWGAAMLAELSAVPGPWARWRFALACARIALFPPRNEIPSPTAERDPVCGLLAVALPPLALPFIYVVTIVIESIGGSPYSAGSQWSEPGAVMAAVKVLIVATVGCLVAGVPLGLVGRWRRERMPWLTAWGLATSVTMIGHFLIGMHLLAGGD